MSRGLIVIRAPSDRDYIKRCAEQMPEGTRFEIKAPRRSLDQNSLMWARLTEISRQLIWHGHRYSPDDWKDYFIHALRRGRWMPNEDGGMTPVGWRTSDLSKDEFSELLDLIDAFATRHGVNLREAA